MYKIVFKLLVLFYLVALVYAGCGVTFESKDGHHKCYGKDNDDCRRVAEHAKNRKVCKSYEHHSARGYRAKDCDDSDKMKKICQEHGCEYEH
ncbi:hypothetical protein G6F70_001887 [Rhizopus microsporus]|uniref:Lipoprotein n=1 Tax=Rhizopus azygosporus TaxID=86630 RepID=A0A367KE15_RHIAZ|nr:hypothetical protein G6F71_003470 [Rhizopus microsporus]RCI00429.1 hypothetical protein CU097_015530 [Rhizopus azygosporus]KAG1202855.1 hypothetical protein G6F70_001887 [Rhizopus microsporus]KAG1212963.1 hypothetical protein G6F69_003225 [Rhizopus microsporus]KAG1237528.1 hypothetical protein G6F67_001136 [Rhizopus microsporus]